MTDDVKTASSDASRLHQVGSRYAVRDYLRRILITEGKHALEDPDGWQQVAQRMTKGKMPADAAERLRHAIEHGPQSADVLSIAEEEGRSLGRKTQYIHVLRGSPSTVEFLHDHGPQQNYEQEWLLANRETVEIRHDRIEFVLNPYGVGFTRHMLERVYERENVNTGEMDDAMTTRITDLYGQIAYCLAKGLLMPPPNALRDLLSRVVMPFGDGLAIVEKRSLTEKRKPEMGDVIRASIRHGRISARLVPQNEINVMRAEIDGQEYVTRTMWIATTYLSDEILRPEQREYRDLYLETADPDEIRLCGRIMWDVTGRVSAMRQRGIGSAEEARLLEQKSGHVTPTVHQHDAAGKDNEAKFDRMRTLARQMINSDASTGIWTWGQE